MTHQALTQISCSALSGVGPKLLEKLAKCHIHTVQDLLFHLPFRYQDRTHVTPMANLRAGDYAVIEGYVTQIQIVNPKRPSLQVALEDSAGSIQLRFFHFTAAQKNNLAPGTHLRCFGEVRQGFRGLEMTHPEYRRLLDHQPIEVEETLTPIYPTTQGLSQTLIRKLTDQALALLHAGHLLQELLPAELLAQWQFMNLSQAIAFIHRPPPEVSVQQLQEGTHPAQQRLVFEELLAQRLSLQKIRWQAQSFPAPVLNPPGQLSHALLDTLPFKPTAAQQRVSAEILQDIKQAYPMLRLVQGDVGSGKTLVAALAMLTAVEAGYQTALMAPTDILAEQHYQNFSQWLQDFEIDIVWLAGKHKGKKRQHMLDDLVSGKAAIAIGTHALFQKQVQFYNLGLFIIDEQHRFGVHQRLALLEKGVMGEQHPHQLIMTATPIPRTLSMTAYADLDVSVIDELPPGRTPVKTVVIPNSKRDSVIQRIKQACLQGRQSYWVCALIDESEQLQCQAAEKTFELLQQTLPELTIGLIHGRMKPKEKQTIMQAFKAHELDLLVATTVIEVGVDVPNASLMIMENAERLGLSQLHQLRGRVGRGATESFCILLYQSPLSQTAKSRLAVMRDTNDGFVVAQKDLELRGPGEVLGTRQTGLVQFRIANLSRDSHWLPKVKQTAQWLHEQHPSIVDPLIERWLGDSEKYSAV